MRQPDFTPEERVLINWYLQKPSAQISAAVIPELAFAVPTLILASWGIYSESLFPVGLALCMLVLFRACMLVYELSWLPALRGVVRKYEEFVERAANVEWTDAT